MPTTRSPATRIRPCASVLRASGETPRIPPPAGELCGRGDLSARSSRRLRTGSMSDGSRGTAKPGISIAQSMSSNGPRSIGWRRSRRPPGRTVQARGARRDPAAVQTRRCRSISLAAAAGSRRRESRGRSRAPRSNGCEGHRAGRRRHGSRRQSRAGSLPDPCGVLHGDQPGTRGSKVRVAGHPAHHPLPSHRAIHGPACVSRVGVRAAIFCGPTLMRSSYFVIASPVTVASVLCEKRMP